MFNESIKMAIDGMISNKLRTLLTLLGIIIGVGAVIAMVSLGFGVKEQVKNNISSLGSNLLIVMSGGRQRQMCIRDRSGCASDGGRCLRHRKTDRRHCLYCPGCFFILSISCWQPKLDCQC